MSFHCFYDRNKSISVLDTFFYELSNSHEIPKWEIIEFLTFSTFLFFFKKHSFDILQYFFSFLLKSSTHSPIFDREHLSRNGNDANVSEREREKVRDKFILCKIYLVNKN
jgi:hypothetical protein